MIGTAAVVLLIALTAGLQDAAESSIGDNASLTQVTIRSGFRRDDSSPTLDLDAVTEIASLSDVSAVIPMLSMQGSIELRSGNLTGSAQVYGVYPATLAYLGVTAEKGTLTLDNNDPYGVVVGATVEENFYDTDADTFTATEVDLMSEPVEMRIYSQSSSTRSSRKLSLQVNGVLESGSSQDSMILMPMDTVIDLNERISGESIDPDEIVFSQIIVQASSRETAGDVMDALTDLGYNASGMGSYLSQLNGFFSIMGLMLGGVGSVALLVAAFGVANTMTMAILERTQEIGLMKAVGATDQAILTIFLIEAGLVGVIGGSAGLVISYTFQYLVNTYLSSTAQSGTSTALSFLNLDVSQLNGSLIMIQPELAIFALVLATCIGIGAGLYPSMRAARMMTVLALKSE
ncbi:MAG: ABC transporter permease [Anaerolineae bacterium]|nr:ABC transporter permease [Anaerolineae bacterium]